MIDVKLESTKAVYNNLSIPIHYNFWLVHILPKISFCVLWKKVSHSGLEQHEDERMTKCVFLDELHF